MNQLPSIPPRDPGFQLGAPMDISATATPAPKFRVKKYLHILRKFWWIPLVTLILALGAAVAEFKSEPPEFVATASMWQTEKLNLGSGAEFAEDQQTYFGTLTAVLQSGTLRDLALQRLAAAGTNNIAVDKNGNPIDVEISVSQAPGSEVFEVQGISLNSVFTPIYLNALIDSYLDYKRTARKDISDVTLNSISDQLARLGEDMKSDQAILTQYEESNNIVVLEQDNQVGGTYLATLRTELADYQLQSNVLSAVALEKGNSFSYETTNVANSLFEQVAGNQTASSPVSQSEMEFQQIETLKFQRAKLGRYLRPDHPKIVDLDKQIAEAQNLLDVYKTQNQQDLATARQALQIRMDGVENAIAYWEGRVNFDSARIAEAEDLKANITRNQSMFDELTTLMNSVDITKNIDQDPLAILQRASGSTHSYAKLKSNIQMASFGGLALGLGIVFLIAWRDDRFSSVVEVNERVGDSVVGQVPEIPELRHGAPAGLLANGSDQHMYVESYRSLRSALLYFAVDGVRPKVLLITSAVPDEGKSTIASNLSCAMALGGSRVLLIDADLRKGALHEVMGLKGKPGLADLLLQPGDLDKIIQSSPMPNLSFLARGSGQRNPGDLFVSRAFDSILAKVREQYDYVIIDTSPVFAADDATTLAPKADGTLFVVRSRFSRSGIVKEALDLLYQRQAAVLGLILNRTDANDRSYHYYKYSEYHKVAEM